MEHKQIMLVRQETEEAQLTKIEVVVRKESGELVSLAEDNARLIELRSVDDTIAEEVKKRLDHIFERQVEAEIERRFEKLQERLEEKLQEQFEERVAAEVERRLEAAAERQ